MSACGLGPSATNLLKASENPAMGYSKEFAEKYIDNPSPKDQSKVIDKTTGARIGTCIKGDKYISQVYEQATLYDSFYHGFEQADKGEGACLGTRKEGKPYEWQSYKKIAERATNFGSGLISKCGLAPGQESFLGIFSGNKLEWVLSDKAALFYNMIVVPLYSTLGDQAMRFVTKQVELNVLVVGDNKMLSEVQKKVLSFDEGKSLKHIIVINSDDAKDTMKEIEKNFSVKCHKFKDIEAAGADNKHDHVKPSPEDVFVINYTSGTTGDPKGVMLTHKNGLADVGGVLCTISGVTTLTNEDVWLSYLPLPHVFERAVQIAMFQVGGRVGFFQGSLPLLADDLKTLAPTLFGGVPRVWARFYDKIQQAVSASAVKKFLFNKAVAAKKAQLAKGICNNTSLWDKIVLKNAQAILGGRCKVAFSGGAPISADVMNTLRAVFGIPILDGYGQTECMAACGVTCMGNWDIGLIPICVNEIKLESVEEMNYLAENNEGEICIRGANVMKGYFKNEEKTKETIDSDGWLHTGDVGRWLPNGALQVFDRKKNIFKLAQGEYIAPEKIENILARAAPVAQVFIYGDSLETALVLVAVLCAEGYAPWAKANKLPEDIKDAVKSADVSKAILNEIVKLGKSSGLLGFELPKAIYLEDDPFSVEKDLLTPTLKSKRNKLKDYYQSQIDEMYKSLKA